MPFSVLRDAISPTVVLTVPARPLTGTFLVQWFATDAHSGVQGYDVEYRIMNDEWQPWFTATTQTQATFNGELGQMYAFRVKATDNVSNTSDWQIAETRPVVVKKYYTIAGVSATSRSAENQLN